MKKIILCLILICSPVFAGEAELKEEQKILLAKLQQYQVVMDNIRIRLIEIQGALKYIKKEAVSGQELVEEIDN